jgi:hypothetical protein
MAYNDQLEQLSQGYLTNQLKSAIDVKSGLTKPWETPEYQSMAEGLNKFFLTNKSELDKTMAAKGITGGAAADLYSKLNSTDMSQKLNAINQIRTSYQNAGTGIAESAMDRQLKEWQTQIQAVLEREAMHRKSQESKMQGITAGSVQGMKTGGETCGFIFIEGNALTDNVRTLRDEMFPKGGIVENGYRRLATWLVPKMSRNWFVKKIVRVIMLNPICSIADHYYGYNSYGWVFRPIGHFWKKVFEKLGR